MKRLILISFVAVMLVTATAVAHPHFNKSISTTLNGVDVKVSYQTTPANMMHANEAAVGQFVSPRGPQVEVSANLMAGSMTIPAGTYTLGVIKNGSNDWTMALYPGSARGNVDMSKVIKLDSMYSSSMGEADHMLIDVTPGHGKHEGKATLTLHFGNMYLSGALS